MQVVTDSLPLWVLSQTAAGAERWHSRMQTGCHGGRRERETFVICCDLLHRLDTYKGYIVYTNILYIYMLNSYCVETYRAMHNYIIQMLRLILIFSVKNLQFCDLSTCYVYALNLLFLNILTLKL